MTHSLRNPLTSATLPFVLLLVLGCLSACATSRENTYLKTTADNVLLFDRSKTVSVSARNRDNLAELNLSDSVRDVLKRNGIRVGGPTNYDYVLQVSTVSGTTSQTVYKTAISTSYSSIVVAGQGGNASTKTYTSVPVQEQSGYRAISLTLWDAQDINQRLPVIWRGIVVGPTHTIRGHEVDAIQQLIARLGITDDVTLSLSPDGPAGLALPMAGVSEAPPGWSDYFSVRGTQVNEYSMVFDGKRFDGYLKTRHVKTRQFDGFVQAQGYKKYDAPESELETFALGSGAYIVREDGLYSVDSGELRDLAETTAQKVFSLPLRLGETNTVNLFPGATIKYTVERFDSLVTPVGRFDDCVIIAHVMSMTGQSDVGERNWFCKGVGFAKQESVPAGETSILTNIVRAK